jgi:hypothetical protein
MTSMLSLFWQARRNGQFKNLAEVSDNADLNKVDGILAALVVEAAKRQWDEPKIVQGILDDLYAALQLADDGRRAEEFAAVAACARAYEHATLMDRSLAKAWLRGE